MVNKLATAWNREDRDLLIELKTTMQALRDDMREIKTNIDDRQNDHETRIRKGENSIAEHETLIKIWGPIVSTILGSSVILSHFFGK